MARLAIGRFFYSFKYRVGEYGLRALVVSLPLVPRRSLELFTAVMARLSWLLLRKFRTRMELNLENALGAEITGVAQRRALMRRAWNNFALGVLDTIAIMHMSKEAIGATIALEGEEHVKTALAKGKGVIGLSAHLGGFTLIGGRLVAAGYPCSIVVKQPNDAHLARLMTAYRAQLGLHTISAKPRQEAVRGILKALRRNEIVLVIADEFKSGGVEIKFMGQTAAAPRGPAALALRTGAVTLPVFAPRMRDGSVVVQVGEAIEPVNDDDVEVSVAATTRLFTSHIEAAVRRYPDQWNWFGFPRPDRISRSEHWPRQSKAKIAGAQPTGSGSNLSVGRAAVEALSQKRKEI
jgi:KDO2-lipid IV(A) lauroyltransferase